MKMFLLTRYLGGNEGSRSMGIQRSQLLVSVTLTLTRWP